MAEIEGGCHCGSVRYRIEGAVGDLTICHCRACQRQSASAFGMSLAIRVDAFRLVSGALKSFDMLCDSGRIKVCSFCPVCGSRIHHVVGEGLSLKAGTLDDPGAFAPSGHYWAATKLPWVEIPEDLPQSPDDGSAVVRPVQR